MEIKEIPTYAALSRRSGVSPDTVAKTLAGRNAKRSTLTKLADVLGVTYIDLLNVREGNVAGTGSDTPVPATDLQGLAARLDRQTEALNALAAQVERLVDAQVVPKATAHLVSQAVAGALRVTLPDILRAAGLPPK